MISWWCQKVQCRCLVCFWELAMANWLLTPAYWKSKGYVDKLLLISHNHIRHVISFHFGHFSIKFGQMHWKKINQLSNQFVFKDVFFKLLVGSSRELYPRVHKNIINLTYMFFRFHINVIISYSFKELAKMRARMYV